jgi:FkbM family methyltransferase
MFYSQNKQDEYLENHIFKGYKNGVFMDVGANDGVCINNTLYFEKNHNWTGFNIEPIKMVFDKLVVNRPSDININCAVSNNDGTAEFICNTGYTEMISGLKDNFDPRHSVRLDRENKMMGSTTEIIKVETRRIESICNEYNIKHIHYLSIDVEGAEFEVIKSINFDKVYIDVIEFENNYNDVSIPIIEYLENKGYIKIHQSMDIFMIHKDSIFYNKEIKFFIYEHPDITLNNWLQHLHVHDKTLTSHLDEQLYHHFKKHPRRTLNPYDASIFIIGIPMVKSYNNDLHNYQADMYKSISNIINNPFFKKKNGRDHLILADDCQLSAWASMFTQYKDIKEFYQNSLEYVTSTRFEAYGCSKWACPSDEIRSKIPASFFNTDWELTRLSIIVPYNPYVGFIITPRYDDWYKRTNYIFYCGQMRGSSHESTEIRHLPLNTLQHHPNCYLQTNVPFEEWKHNIINSKYVLCIRGDTSGSHAFINAISAGCIPVIISDLFEYGATPFNDLLNLNMYSVVISEKEYIKNPEILLNTLENLSDECIRDKLNNLIEVQKMMLLDHPESKLCSLILDTFYKNLTK